MQMNKVLKQIIAINLIFVLTFINFAVVGKSAVVYAADVVFENQNAKTANDNVEFNAYFENSNKEKLYATNLDVNESTFINIALNVKNNGYLKDAVIKLSNMNDENNTSFKIINDDKKIEQNSIVQEVCNNEIKLKLINSSENKNIINIPITYNFDKYIDLARISQNNKVVLNATYVDNLGKEVRINKEIILNIKWTDKNEINVETKTEKFVTYQTSINNGFILQTSVKVSGKDREKSLPIEKTNIDIDIPKIEKATLAKIQVIANSTEFTNGLKDNNVKFDSSNWVYDEAQGKVKINVKNEAIDNKYYSSKGTDEYLITYTFVQTEQSEEQKISQESKVNVFVSRFNEFERTIKTSSINTDLSAKVGELVSYEVDNQTSEISKAFMYLNKNSDSDFYDIELKAVEKVNISYKEIVDSIILKDTESYYIDAEGNKYLCNDLYYKEIAFNKENIKDILGENGKIDITDETGNTIYTLTDFNGLEVDENGNIVIKFNNGVKSIKIVFSKPEKEGNINILTTKSLKSISYEKENIRLFDKIITQQEVLAGYTYVDTYVNIANKGTETKLKNTKTDAKIIVNPGLLSTTNVNEDVEVRIELNNSNENSDIYGNSEFYIEFPSYIKNIEVNDAKILYGEGLEIESTELVDSNVIRLIIKGNQNRIANEITAGTTILFNTKIETSMLTPSKEDIVKLNYKNFDATSYAETNESGNGFSTYQIEYMAPAGVIAINGIKNYNDENKEIYSIISSNEDVIPILEPQKTATMELLVMNNNKNDISNISILGRIPYKDNKSVLTEADLNTTVDTVLKSEIRPNDPNITVYYSENGEATQDLNDTNNNWKKSVESLDKVKSYLIVLSPDYRLNSAGVIKFEYDYEIPANLEHNNNINSNYAVYYTNNTSEAVLSEKVESKKIGLTTGEGPVLKIELKSNASNIVKEKQEIVYTAKVTNTGDMPAKNVEVLFDSPKYTNLKSYSTDEELVDTKQSSSNNEVTFTMDELAVGTSEEMNIYVNTTNLPTIEEYYENDKRFTVNDSGDYVLKDNGVLMPIDSIPEIKLTAKAKLTATALGKALESEEVTSTLESADFSIEETTEEESLIIKENKEVEFNISITNLKSETQENVIAKTIIPEGLTFKEAYMLINGENQTNNAEYNASSGEVLWNIGNMEADGYRQLKLIVYTDDLPAGLTSKTIQSNSVVYGSGTETYTSNTVKTTVGKGNINVYQTSSSDNTYITEGDTLKYIFTIKNDGTTDADNIVFTDSLPDGVKPQRMEVTVNGQTSKRTISGTSTATLKTSIAANQTVQITIVTIAASLNGLQEKSITNKATIEGTNIETITTNEVTHIIEADANAVRNSQNERSSTNERRTSTARATNTNTATQTQVTTNGKTYTISGIAWVDENNNGMRDSNEARVPEVIAKLINSSNNTVEKESKTNGNGEYTFTGLLEGNYFIIFEYDTLKYGLTEYQKSGVSSNVNSDVIANKYEENGQTKQVAVTDVISLKGVSISGIDIGFTVADRFNLSLDMVVSKVTVQTNEGTKATEFNDKLAKVEIGSKYISGATVLVEYTITVKNQGDIAGTARKLVDYIPQGMTFNSSLNSDWYSGSDGNVYTTALTDKVILPGESVQIKLTLTKTMIEANQGLVHNEAEIFEAYNAYGIPDLNSTPGNRAQGEDDISSADTIVTVRTGESLIYISVIISILVVIGCGIIIIQKSMISKKY